MSDRKRSGEAYSPAWRKLERENKALEARVEELEAAIKEAYEEGWGDGRYTRSVTGDPAIDWEDSDTKAQYGKEKQ